MSNADRIRKQARRALGTGGAIFLIAGMVTMAVDHSDVGVFALGALLVLLGVMQLTWGLSSSFAHRGDAGGGGDQDQADPNGGADRGPGG